MERLSWLTTRKRFVAYRFDFQSNPRPRRYRWECLAKSPVLLRVCYLISRRRRLSRKVCPLAEERRSARRAKAEAVNAHPRKFWSGRHHAGAQDSFR